MRTIKVGFFSTVQLFDSIHEITKSREHEFNKWAMMDLGVGNTLESIDMHIKSIHMFATNNRMQDVVTEIMNMRLNYYYAIEKIDFSSLCFSVMVHKINNEIIHDVSSFDAAHSVCERLKKIGIKSSHVRESVNEIKKKLKLSLGLASQNDIMEMIAYTGLAS